MLRNTHQLNICMKNKLENTNQFTTCMNNILLFICDGNDQGDFNYLIDLPKDVIFHICKLTVEISTFTQENFAFSFLMEMLEGYCEINNWNLPQGCERKYIKEIIKVILRYQEENPSNYPLVRNAGFLLFRISQCISLDTIDKKDGLFYIFKMLNAFTAIDISDFYPESPLRIFLEKNREMINCYKVYPCWIEMILKESGSFINPNQAVKLILSREGFSEFGKAEMIVSFLANIQYSKKPTKLLNMCFDFLSTSRQEQLGIFEWFLEKSKYEFALHYFCLANQLSVPVSFQNFPKTKTDAVLKMLCVLFQDYITQSVDSLFIDKLLDHVGVGVMELGLYDFDERNCAYELMIAKKEFLADFEIIEKKFNECFGSDVMPAEKEVKVIWTPKPGLSWSGAFFCGVRESEDKPVVTDEMYYSKCDKVGGL